VEWIDSDARSQASTSSMKDSSSNSGRTPAANRNQTSLACRRAVDRGSCYGRTTTKLTQLRGRADGRGKRQVDGHATGGERWGGRIRDLQIRRCRRRQARRRRWMRRGRPAAGAATDRRRADLSRPRPRGRRIRDVRTRWRADPADGGRGRRRLGCCCLMNAKGSRDRRSGTRRRGATTGHDDESRRGGGGGARTGAARRADEQGRAAGKSGSTGGKADPPTEARDERTGCCCCFYCCCDSIYTKANGFGAWRSRPREGRIHPPGDGAAGRRWVADRIGPRALIACYEMEWRVKMLDVLREALWAYIEST